MIPAPAEALQLSDIPWTAHGNDWIKKRVHKYGLDGTIVAFAPQGSGDGEMALYHVVFDDNEIEDLEELEVIEVFCCLHVLILYIAHWLPFCANNHKGTGLTCSHISSQFPV